MKYFFRGHHREVMSILLGVLLSVGLSVFAASTIGTDISTDGSLIVTGTAGLGTTTVTNLISSNTSTSTFAGGIDVSTGCFSVNGSCVSGGGGGGVSSFNDLNDFAVTRVSGTELSVAGGRAIGMTNIDTTATINIAAGIGSGDLRIYVDRNDRPPSIHAYNIGTIIDPSKVSGDNFTMDPDGNEFLSNENSILLYDWAFTSDVFDPTFVVDVRAIGLSVVRSVDAGAGNILRSSQFPGTRIIEIDPNGPTGLWQKWNVTVNGANFDITAPDGTVTSVAMAAALTQDIPIFTLPANSDPERMRIKPSVQFAGVATLTLTLGITGNSADFTDQGFDLLVAPSATNLQETAVGGYNPGNITVNSTDFVLGLTSTVDNLDQLTAGSLDIWVKYSVLP